MTFQAVKCNVCPPDDSKAARKIWDLTDKVVQQISTQREDGEDPDVALLNMNVNQILEL